MRLDRVPVSALKAFLPGIFLDYAEGDRRVLPAFRGGDFHSMDELARRAARSARPLPPDVARAWRGSLNGLGAPDRVMDALSRLEQGAACVVTGQQPGLFGGPAYNLYKAATAIKLAALLRDRTGRPCEAVFWNHSDDHSLAEFSEIRMPGENGFSDVKLRTGDAPLPAYLFDARWIYPALIRRLESEGLRDDLTRLLVESYRDNPAAGFSRILLRLFGDLGLVPIEPRHVDGERARGLFERCLTRPEEVRGRLEEGTALVASMGYEPLLRGVTGSGLFRIRRGLREKVEDAKGALMAGGEALTVRELLDGRAGRLSAQVFLRPILQDAILPTCAYVGGPNEIAYLAELGPLYEWMEVEPPVLVPRLSGTLLTASMGRTLDRLGVPASRLFGGRDEILSDLIRSTSGNLLTRLDMISTGVRKGVQEIAPSLLDVDRSLESSVEKTLSNLQRIFSGLQDRVLKAVQGRQEVQTQRLERLMDWIRPGGDVQERRIGLVGVLLEAGRDFPARLVEAIEPLDPSHRIIREDAEGG